MKKNILLMVNFSLILIPFFIYVYLMETETLANVVQVLADNGCNIDDLVNNFNKYFDSSIYLETLFYILFSIVNYIFFIFKKDKALIITFVIEFLIFICYLSVASLEIRLLLLFIPLVNGFIYWYINYQKLN